MLGILGVFLQAAAGHILYLALHLESGSFPRPLTPEQERDALAALQQGGAARTQARDTLIRQSIASQEGNKARTEASAHMAEQDKELELRRAQYRAEQDRAKAEADLAYKVQQENSRKSLETERAAAELIRLQKETELQAQQVQIQREKLSIEVRERAEAERDAKIAAAEAQRQVVQAQAEADLYRTQKEAEARLIQAQKEAEAQYLLAEKEAEAIRMKGDAEAAAMLKKAEAMKEYGQAAMLQMLIDKLPDPRTILRSHILHGFHQILQITLFSKYIDTDLVQRIRSVSFPKALQCLSDNCFQFFLHAYITHCFSSFIFDLYMILQRCSLIHRPGRDSIAV